MARHNVYRDGKVYVCREMCPTCIFRPGNLMRLNRGRVRGMIDEAKRNESCIPCHWQIFYVEGERQDACCRGFFDNHPTQPLQIADRLGLVEFITPADNKEPHATDQSSEARERDHQATQDRDQAQRG